MKSATFDSNIYIRALQHGGPAALLLGHAKAGDLRIDISEEILNETCGVLRDKFKWDGYSIYDAYLKLRALGNLVKPTETLDVVKEDPDDNRILECAVAAGSDFIVSQDKDLLRLGEFRGIPIKTIPEFIEAALVRRRQR